MKFSVDLRILKWTEVICILGVYFSGTGNTKHCVETFVKQYDAVNRSVSIEESTVLEQIAAQDLHVIGYPVYCSNTQKIMQDFINENGICFKGKQMFIIATMGLWSGDGAGCAARLLKKHGATILGGLHLKNAGLHRRRKDSKENNGSEENANSESRQKNCFVCPQNEDENTCP